MFFCRETFAESNGLSNDKLPFPCHTTKFCLRLHEKILDVVYRTRENETKTEDLFVDENITYIYNV